jgi:hypothetical protein
MELLIKAGYDGDPRIEKGFQWLLSMRQNDGGWAIPLRTVGSKYANALKAETMEPDLSKPFSHLVTGVVLRAFAASKKYSKSPDAVTAGKLLSSRFYKLPTTLRSGFYPVSNFVCPASFRLHPPCYAPQYPKMQGVLHPSTSRSGILVR